MAISKIGENLRVTSDYKRSSDEMTLEKKVDLLTKKNDGVFFIESPKSAIEFRGLCDSGYDDGGGYTSPC